ncbi:MAG TPA: hypothetical protein VF603_07160 [Allosphingosinicella sp.]
MTPITRSLSLGLSRMGGAEMLKRMIVVLAAAVCAACSTLPRAEFQGYRDAFAAAQTAAAPIMENYGTRERAEWRRRLQEERAPAGFFEEFRLDDVRTLSVLGLPPGAEAATRAFAAIARYNDTLVALAEDRNIGEARAQLQQVTSELSAVAAPLGTPLAALNRFAGLALEAFRPLIQRDNRAQFRQRVLGGHDEIVGLVDVLRRLAPHQYEIITRPIQDRAREATPADRAPIAEEINRWHRVFADYVFLLNAVEERLNVLKEAIENPRSVPLLERAGAGAADLRAYADGLRRSVTELMVPR